MRPTAKEIRRILLYDPRTGMFVNKISRGSGARAGTVSGTTHRRDGYVHLCIWGRQYKAHRLAWVYMTGRWPRKDVEHKNGIRSSNEWKNLRLANDSENQANAKRRTDNKSGYKGVYFSKSHGKWRATIQVRKKRLRLGVFETVEQAHAAYAAAAKKHFGEFARTA